MQAHSWHRSLGVVPPHLLRLPLPSSSLGPFPAPAPTACLVSEVASTKKEVLLGWAASLWGEEPSPAALPHVCLSHLPGEQSSKHGERGNPRPFHAPAAWLVSKVVSVGKEKLLGQAASLWDEAVQPSNTSHSLDSYACHHLHCTSSCCKAHSC